MSSQKILAIHPGEILLEEFLKIWGISQYRLAKEIAVPPRRINEIVHGKRSVTPDTALRLAKYFNMSAEFWLNLQAKYDLELQKEVLSDVLKHGISKRFVNYQKAQQKEVEEDLQVELLYNKDL